MSIEIPKLIASIVLASGVVNIISGFWFKSFMRFFLLQNIFPLNFIHFSRTLTIIIGVFLIYLARGIWNRKERSWQLTIILLTASLLLHLIKGLDFEESVFTLLVILILVKYKAFFTVKSARLAYSEGVKNALYIFLALFAYSFFGFFALQGEFSHTVTFNNILKDYLFSIFGIGREVLIPLTRPAHWFSDSISTVGFIGISLIFASLFAPFTEQEKTTQEDLDAARKSVLNYGDNSSNYLSLMPDKNIYINPQKTCFVSYKASGDIAVVLGTAIGKQDKRKETLGIFNNHVKQLGLTPVYYNVEESDKKLLQKYNMRFVKIGEEAVINFDKFNIQTPQMKDIRYALNKFDRLGLTVDFYTLSKIPWSIMHDIDNLYNGWVNQKNSPPLTFSLNFYPFPVEDNAYAGVVYNKNRELLSAFSFFPYDGQRRLVLELMLRNQKAPNGTVEGALTKSIYNFKNLGYRSLSLGVAPLSNLGKKEKLLEEKALSFIFENTKRIYKYKSLFKFKKQFNPEWQHKYLAYPSIATIPKVAIALVRVHIQR
jgi:phosphatidylglycerol lysyltransferase